MPNDPSERMTQGALEAFWLFEAATLLRPCDGDCEDTIVIGDMCYRPAGFFTKPEIPHMTARDLGIREWYCVDCGFERREFLTKAINILKSGQAGEKQ